MKREAWLWTEEQIARFRELWGKPGWTGSTIGKAIGKSKNAVIGRARREGMAEVFVQRWSEAKVNQLRDLVYLGHDNVEIGAIMGISEDWARRARQAHKIGRAIGLKQSDMETLRQLAPTGVGARAIANLLHIGPCRIRRAAQEAGIDIKPGAKVWQKPKTGHVWTISNEDRERSRRAAAERRRQDHDKDALRIVCIPVPDHQEPRGCRWIEGSGADWRVCQATPEIPGTSWCRHHRRIVFTQPAPMTEAA